MALIVKSAFPNLEELDREVPTRPDPLAVFSPTPIQLRGSDSGGLFPDLDGHRVDEGRHLRRQALEQRRADELAEKVARALEEARQQGLEEGRTAGFEEGRAEGVEQGHSDASKEAELLRAQLVAAVESLTRAREELTASLEIDQAEVALRLAGELAAGAIDVEPERIVELARQGTQMLAESDTIAIRAAVGPAVLLREAQASLAQAVNISSLRIVEDPSLDPNGCIVESDFGRVDLRVSQRLATARELLKSLRNED